MATELSITNTVVSIKSNLTIERYGWRCLKDCHLLYFYGIAKWPYLAFSPIFSIREFPKHHEFIVGLEESFSVTNPIPKESLDRGYMNRLTKARIHQPVFRGGVINASETSCAICRLHHPDLLDAAHIIPDSRE